MEKFSEDDLFLELQNISVQRNGKDSFNELNWKILKSEHWAIVGPVGTGKSILAEAIAGNLITTKGKILYHFVKPEPSGYLNLNKNISYISFAENSASFNYSKHYYQQRFNASQSEESITVKEFLRTAEITREIIDLFSLDELMERQFIKLSNGQTRKVRIAKALSQHPPLLILDDPFIGLDNEARSYLENIINRLADSGTQVILITNRDFIPSSITHVLELENFKIKDLKTAEEFRRSRQIKFETDQKEEIKRLLEIISPQETNFLTAVSFRNVNISYGEKQILKNINWTISKGEKWALLGHNGAGKSTLLSLITADNPQAYSQEFSLFDRKRGTGESIWEIKKRIGFISPEIHLYFRSDMNCVEVAGTGFLDTLFLSRSLSTPETQLLDALFSFFNILHLKEKTFLRISTGEQRVILFIRAVVKNPALFVLDEPFQGMDSNFLIKCQHLLELYCTSDKTLIFVSHLEEEIPSFINRHYLLKDGVGEIRNKENMSGFEENKI
jgi:molybdate transport system ATP-binding protein